MNDDLDATRRVLAAVRPFSLVDLDSRWLDRSVTHPAWRRWRWMRILSGVGTREYNEGLCTAISADKHDSRERNRAAACQEQLGDWRQINWPSEIAVGF
jgi:hypothetical protein